MSQLVKAGVRLVPRLVEARGQSARFENGVEEEISAVVWATGYRDDASWVHVPGVADCNGSFIEARCVSPVPGLFFVGRSWQSTRGSALLLGVGRDAEAIAGSVRRSISTPRSDEQRATAGGRA